MTATPLPVEQRQDWRNYTVDKRGCGGCTVAQYEDTQRRLVIGILRLAGKWS